MKARSPARLEPELPGIPPAVGVEPLQLKIPAETKRRFKAQAALRGISAADYFIQIFEHYERSRASGG